MQGSERVPIWSKRTSHLPSITFTRCSAAVCRDSLSFLRLSATAKSRKDCGSSPLICSSLREEEKGEVIEQLTFTILSKTFAASLESPNCSSLKPRTLYNWWFSRSSSTMLDRILAAISASPDLLRTLEIEKYRKVEPFEEIGGICKVLIWRKWVDGVELIQECFVGGRWIQFGRFLRLLNWNHQMKSVSGNKKGIHKGSKVFVFFSEPFFHCHVRNSLLLFGFHRGQKLQLFAEIIFQIYLIPEDIQLLRGRKESKRSWLVGKYWTCEQRGWSDNRRLHCIQKGALGATDGMSKSNFAFWARWNQCFFLKIIRHSSEKANYIWQLRRFLEEQERQREYNQNESIHGWYPIKEVHQEQRCTDPHHSLPRICSLQRRRRETRRWSNWGHDPWVWNLNIKVEKSLLKRSLSNSSVSQHHHYNWINAESNNRTRYIWSSSLIQTFHTLLKTGWMESEQGWKLTFVRCQKSLIQVCQSLCRYFKEHQIIVIGHLLSFAETELQMSKQGRSNEDLRDSSICKINLVAQNHFHCIWGNHFAKPVRNSAERSENGMEWMVCSKVSEKITLC